MTAGESVLLASVLFAIAAAIWRLLTARPEEPSLYQAPPRASYDFPPQPTAFLRDVETDALFDTSLTGFIRHSPDGAFLYYRGRMLAAIECRAPQAYYYARMTASLAFGLHPALRECVTGSAEPAGDAGAAARAESTAALTKPTVIAIETWPRRTARSMNVDVIH